MAIHYMYMHVARMTFVRFYVYMYISTTASTCVLSCKVLYEMPVAKCYMKYLSQRDIKFINYVFAVTYTVMWF